MVTISVNMWRRTLENFYVWNITASMNKQKKNQKTFVNTHATRLLIFSLPWLLVGHGLNKLTLEFPNKLIQPKLITNVPFNTGPFWSYLIWNTRYQMTNRKLLTQKHVRCFEKNFYNDKRIFNSVISVKTNLVQCSILMTPASNRRIEHQNSNKIIKRSPRFFS